MFSVKPANLPENVLLSPYAGRAGHYTDCFVLQFQDAVDLETYITAFYTTWLFKLERFILTWFANRPSTDGQAAQLAEGTLDTFAAWTVENRTTNELLMCDMSGRTRSWFRVENGQANNSILMFGSAVVPANTDSAQPKLGLVFDMLLGFHKLYSRALLAAAVAKLKRQSGLG